VRGDLQPLLSLQVKLPVGGQDLLLDLLSSVFVSSRYPSPVSVCDLEGHFVWSVIGWKRFIDTSMKHCVVRFCNFVKNFALLGVEPLLGTSGNNPQPT